MSQVVSAEDRVEFAFSSASWAAVPGLAVWVEPGLTGVELEANVGLVVQGPNYNGVPTPVEFQIVDVAEMNQIAWAQVTVPGPVDNWASIWAPPIKTSVRASYERRLFVVRARLAENSPSVSTQVAPWWQTASVPTFTAKEL